MRTITSLALAIAALALAVPVAHAFHHHGQFQEYADGRAETPGSGGLYYTGSRRDLGLRCSACHVEAPGAIRADVTFSPALSGGRYVPGATYRIAVAMTGESRGLTECSSPMVNRNGITAMIVGPSGFPVGEIGPDQDARRCGVRFPPVGATQTTAVFGDCEAAVGVQDTRALTRWEMSWRAPSAGSGEATLWLGVVDGDCMFDSYRDDVLETRIAIPEGSTAALLRERAPARSFAIARREPALPARRREISAPSLAA